MAERRARQRALLQALREAERTKRPIDVATVARTSGYSPSSIRTYFTKRLEGVLVVRDDAGRWWARGALDCTEAAFARRMSQKAGSASEAIKTEEGWRELLRRLLYEGSRREYRLSASELQWIELLRPDGGDAEPPDPEEPGPDAQPRLL